ncbi:Stc1 domain-containing protein [Hirsutella rhossiliensis]|uniref:Stc1 domain-containing protein n=1 Tax=Hirsutella rhossiliensis TaxID=111463 RepID=A0A9P8N5W3_9HYPO|nr:stc1 domain-containing protein [Hirsutella rhossiliensis]KAH0968218.1 stc1 domain-containing protein [Hirsutella rhossiliensis]
MAGSKNNVPANLARKSAVPTRFRCKVGGEWKPLSSFSNKQQSLIQGHVDRQAPINAANTGMTCRDHSGVPRTEIRCELCALIKPLAEFSQNSRKSGDYICKRCCAWSETQEPEVTPSPLETGHISVEEDENEVWEKNYMESVDFFPDDMPQAPITELSSLGIEGKKVLSQLKAASVSGSSRASSVVSVGSSLPPHLRARELQAGSSASKAALDDTGDSSSALGSALMSMSMSTATTMREAAVKGRASENVAFNAWGPDGKHHKGVKSPTVPSSTDEGSAASRGQGRDLGKSSNQSQAAAQETPKSRGKGNWYKAPRLSRAELQAQPAIPHVSARHHDANLDRQLRMNYCESEDSDF